MLGIGVYVSGFFGFELTARRITRLPKTGVILASAPTTHPANRRRSPVDRGFGRGRGLYAGERPEGE